MQSSSIRVRSASSSRMGSDYASSSTATQSSVSVSHNTPPGRRSGELSADLGDEGLNCSRASPFRARTSPRAATPLHERPRRQCSRTPVTGSSSTRWLRSCTLTVVGRFFVCTPKPAKVGKTLDRWFWSLVLLLPTDRSATTIAGCSCWSRSSAVLSRASRTHSCARSDTLTGLTCQRRI